MRSSAHRMVVSLPTPAATLLALTLTTVAASAFRDLRLEAAGLLIHPYLVPLGLLFFLIAIRRLALFPQQVLIAFVLFAASYSITTLPGQGALGEILKIGSSLVTVLTAAVLIRDRTDFRAAALGLNLAVLAMSIKGFLEGSMAYTGYSPLEEVANKNAFSLYAIPAVGLAGFVIIDRGAAKWLRIVLGVAVVVTSFSIFSSANRSGWLGFLLVGLLLFGRGRRVRSTLAIAVLAGLTYLALYRYGSTEIMEYRFELTVKGYHSDTRREDMFRTSVEVGLENPLMGASPTGLQRELARRLRAEETMLDPHNVYGHVIGGSGFLVFGALLYLGLVLWRRPNGIKLPPGSALKAAHDLMRMMVVLFAVRGMFTREVLYAPGFPIALGLALGLCRIEGAWIRTRAPKRGTVLGPAVPNARLQPEPP